jgi:Xaa-Pro aminopeptidase
MLSPLHRQALLDRRHALTQQYDRPIILWSGAALPRNFLANTYPFRASSHFLYFAGLPLRNAALRLADGAVELFWDEPSPKAALWQSLPPSRATIAEQIGATAHYPFAALEQHSTGAATIPSPDPGTRQGQEAILGRSVGLGNHLEPHFDRSLAEAIVSLRLVQDEFALGEIRKALTVTIAAHQAGMQRSLTADRESQVRSAMEGIILDQDYTCAYGSIVTTHGEILHNDRYGNPILPGDLILADVGAEATSGWASDITRTWPASGQFTSPQRDVYNLVLNAHDACIAALKPGVEYRSIHLLGCQILAQGLVDLGILRGSAADLVDQDIHALFFPHGIGHLLGLDVHDMEDLGDLAGYAPGRQRSDRFGLCYLRLDRPLQAGMVVTIEPGFYQVPSILHPARTQPKYQDWVNWDHLDRFATVRGIRIEDDLYITPTGAEVLSAALPVTTEAIETVMDLSS